MVSFFTNGKNPGEDCCAEGGRVASESFRRDLHAEEICTAHTLHDVFVWLLLFSVSSTHTLYFVLQSVFMREKEEQ